MSDPAEEPRQRTARSQKSAWDEAYRQGHPRWRGPSDLDLSGLRGRVLELGCGDGKTAIALAQKGLQVVGLDPSRVALLTLGKRVGSDKLSLVQADALSLPFKEASFDCLASVHFLDHLLLKDRENAVEEMGRVLKPGGLVIGRFFSVNDMRFGKGEEIEPKTYLKGNEIINHYFTEEEVLSLFDGYLPITINSSNKPTKFSGESGHRSLITIELRKL